MKRALKTELWKAFHNPMMWLAIAAGAFVVGASARDCLHAINEYTVRINNLLESGIQVSRSAEGYSLFLFALPYNTNQFSTRLFTYIWPLIAAVPYGWSYMQERRTGVYDQAVSRVGARAYFTAKYIAVFISGGAVVALTVLASLLADAMILPAWALSPNFMLIIENGDFLSTLFYPHPWLHALIWCGMLFLFGGASASMCFFAWTKLRLRALVTIVPFGVLFLMRTFFARLLMTVGASLSQGVFDFLAKLMSLLGIVSVPGAYTSGWDILYFACGITALTLAVGYWRVVKHELD